MATMQLADVFVPDAQLNYIQEYSTTKSALWQSGIVTGDALLAAALNTVHGNQFTFPFNKSVEDEEAEDGDDSDTSITPSKITTGVQKAIRSFKTKAWEAKALAALLANNKPTEAVVNMIVKFWINNYQKVLLSSLKGVFGDNDANDSSDLTYNIYEDLVTGSLDADNYISDDALTEARYTMGDHWDVIGAMCGHSKVIKELRKQEPNSFIPASQSNIGFTTYQGMIVLEDDGMTVTAGTNNPSYQTLLFAPGAIAYENDNSVVMPQEIEWKGDKGNGAGSEVIYTRRSFVMHPRGFDYTPEAADLKNPVTKTNLETAARWDRIVANRKQIGIARLLSNA